MALWTPADLPDLLSWVDPNDSSRMTFRANGRVASYDDKGSAGGTWTTNAATSGGVQIYGPALTTINGNQAFYADNADSDATTIANCLRSPSSINGAFGGANTVGLIAYYSSVGSTIQAASSTSSSGTSRVYGSVVDGSAAGDPRRYRHGTTTSSASNAGTTAYDLAVQTRTGTTLARFTNGTADGTASNGANVSMSAAGYCIAANTIGWGFHGWVGDHIICSSVLSTDDRQKLEGYLAHKWGQTAVLPSDHPYKTDPPETGGGAFTIDGGVGAFSDDGIAAGLRASRRMASAVTALVLSGQNAGTRATRRATAQAGTLSSAGQASPLASRQLDLDFTALTLAGASGLVYGHPMVAAPATYTLAGDVGLSFLRGVSGGVGAFSLAGSAGLRATRRLPLQVTAMALTGQDVDFPAQAILVGGAGAFSLNSAAGLFLARKVTSNAGSYALAGAADLEYSRRVVGLTGAFSFSGSAGLLYGRAISATGDFVFAGIDAGLIADITDAYIMAAETGVFAFAGLVDFARGGWAPIPPVGETWTAQGVTPETWTPVAKQPETWTPSTTNDETWTPVPRRTVTWQ